MRKGEGGEERERKGEEKRRKKKRWGGEKRKGKRIMREVKTKRGVRKIERKEEKRGE
jgi:hypothetical protein